MWKNISILTLMVIVTTAHQLMPFEPFQHYLKKSDANLETRMLKEDSKYRLGSETKPSLYDIKLKFNISGPPTFDGDVEITFQALKGGLTSVVLNAENIDIIKDSVRITLNNGANMYHNHTYDETYQKITFNTKSALNTNVNYVIKIQYTGHMKEDLKGVYLSEYDQGTAKKKLITTHFGQFARRMMPCWDEPQFKAQFKFTITRDANMKAFSNAAIEKPGATVDVFKPTSVISPYALALVIADFVLQENKNEKFGVFARPNASDDTAYALSVGPKLIKAFDDWTDMPYHKMAGVDKMELGAIPDFSAGAMENWGLILHKEVMSLYNKDYANTAQKQLIPTVISHELAHMWFGDLVTCNWFDETYLNEGLARYFQFIALDKVEPLFEGSLQFPVTSTQKAMLADSSSKSFPLSNKGMFSVPEVENMFSTISYDKGGSILRMANNLMGDAKFKKAIRTYLQKRQFKTAVTEDLLTEFESQEAGIVEILSPFIYQAGYPLITVARNGNLLNVTQKRFLVEQKDHNDTTRWTVPLTIATEVKHYENVLSNMELFKSFSKEPLIINITNIKKDYYLFNIQQIGFYRVNYDKENWKAIGKALKSQNHGLIHVLNRAQIVDDLFNLARSGHLTYDFIFSIINYIEAEKHFLPWLSFFNGISYIEQRAATDPLKSSFKVFVQNLLKTITELMNWDDKGDEFWKMNRIQVLQWACKYGVQGACVTKALKSFEDVVKGKNIISDLKPAVYCTGLRQTADNWKKMWERYVKANQATEQEMILQALGCSLKVSDVDLFMDKILTKDIRVHDKPTAYVSAVSGNLENVDFVLDYIIKNTKKWSEVMDVVSTLGDLSARFTKADQFTKLDKHANTLKTEWKKPLLEISKENQKLLEWDAARLPELKQFLDNSAAGKTVSLVLVLLAAVRYLFL